MVVADCMVPTKTVPPETLEMLLPETEPNCVSTWPLAERFTLPPGAFSEELAPALGCRAMPPALAVTKIEPVPPAVTGSLITTAGPVIDTLPLKVDVAKTRCVGVTARVRLPGPVRFDPMLV